MITVLINFYDSNLNEWDGGGANDNWATAENWTNNVAPVPGQTLVFAGSTRLVPNNDFASGTSFNGIKFKSGAGNFDLRLYGTLNLGGGGAAFNNDTSSGLMKIQAVTQEEITFTAAPTFYTKTGASSEIYDVAIVGGSFDMTFDGGGDMAFEGNMYVSGTGNIIKNGSGRFSTNGRPNGMSNPDFTGNVVVNAGVLETGAGIGAAEAEERNDILVNSGATLSGAGYHNGDITIKSGATVSPGFGATVPGTLFIFSGVPTGLFTLESGSTVSIPLDGTAVSGMITAHTFDFTGVNLTIPSVANSVATDSWNITDSPTPTTGTFVDKAEAAEWVVDGRTLRINYNVVTHTVITDVTP